MERVFWVYILANRKYGTLYIGQTSHLANRIAQHRASSAPSFTGTYGVFRLVHVEQYATRNEARDRERRLKRWARPWKIQLIEADNPEWLDLFERYGA